MAITQEVCNSFKQQLLQGIHDSTDTYNIALYVSTATLNKSTTVYTVTGEVATGGGYTAGGIALTGFSATLDTDTAILDWTTDPSWAAATITARGALVYNITDANKACFVLNFVTDIISTNGLFTVAFPTPAAATGLLRLL
jgi:hypothetical protein